MTEFQLGFIALVGVLVLIAIWIIFYFIPVGLWFSALVSGVKINLLQLFLMRWRRVPPSIIVSSMIEGTKAGLRLDANELEAHYLAGGNVTNVVHALVSAQKANINLDFKMATAIDLAGRDVFEAVQMSVNPKVINTPPVAAVAKDGIQLIAKARVTVRANIKQLVGGAGEETVLARVGEGIVSSIGSVRTSVRNCRWIRLMPIRTLRRQRPRSAELWLWLWSRRIAQRHRMHVQRLSWLRRRCHWLWQRHSEMATWVLWITTR